MQHRKTLHQPLQHRCGGEPFRHIDWRPPLTFYNAGTSPPACCISEHTRALHKIELQRIDNLLELVEWVPRTRHQSPSNLNFHWGHCTLLHSQHHLVLGWRTPLAPHTGTFRTGTMLNCSMCSASCGDTSSEQIESVRIRCQRAPADQCLHDRSFASPLAV